MNFLTWNVMVDIGFWVRLTKKKIEQYKLDATSKPLSAKFRLSNRPDKISLLSVDAYSFGDTTEQEKSGPMEYKIGGSFINTNTVQQFDNIDIAAQEDKLLDIQAQRVKDLLKGEQKLSNFIPEMKMIIFGDFKKHTFKYHFLSAANPVENYEVTNIAVASEQLSANLAELNKYIRIYAVDKKQPLPQLVVLKDYEISSIAEFISNPDGNYLFCVTDSSNYPKHTGYHTSTILTIFAEMLQQKLVDPQKLKSVKVLLMKEFVVYGLQKNYTFKNSEVVTLNLSTISKADRSQKISHKLKLVELDLKSFMDDQTLAREAVDLNIKLMKWRLLPNLDIEKIQSKKCLLFGAGTLGCQLSRNLIAWGIKNITFIDYSKVSYSNPVRQTLYDFEDTKGGGKPKAETAAQKLMKIYPQINARGYTLRIPMPGHYVTKQEHIKQAFESIDFLQKLVQQHDALFLLLDSRQARWLPTVLANKYDKACITVGLGFDSFVIVRHGVPPQKFDEKLHKERICCYFCNDIITPQNTMKDRTLDQQCTVTRPGLSFLSSAYASQLYISLIHHPLQHHVWANEEPEKLQTTDLGKLPHHIRGNMSDFQTHIFYGRAFDKCVACSNYILEEYCNNREQFMLKVLNDPSFIHDVVHLTEQLKQFELNECNIIEIVDDDDEMYTEQPKMEAKQQTKE